MKPNGQSRNTNVYAQDPERLIKKTESMFLHARKSICTNDFYVRKFHLGYKLIYLSTDLNRISVLLVQFLTKIAVFFN